MLEKIYMKSMPTVVVWDKSEGFGRNGPPAPNRDDDVWETMKHILDDGSDIEKTARRKHLKKK